MTTVEVDELTHNDTVTQLQKFTSRDDFEVDQDLDCARLSCQMTHANVHINRGELDRSSEQVRQQVELLRTALTREADPSSPIRVEMFLLGAQKNSQSALSVTFRLAGKLHGKIHEHCWDPLEDWFRKSVSKRILNKGTWLATLEEPARQPTIDLFQRHPFISHPLNGTAYKPLQVGFDTLDDSQKAIYRSLDSLPHGLAPVVGTAACSKTRFLAYIAQMLLYNDPDQKILVVYPNKAAVDGFPAKAYAFPSETEAGVSFVREMGNPNDDNDAEAGLDAGLSEQDPFLFTFVIQSTIKDSSGKRPARKDFDKASMLLAYLRNFDKGRRVSDLRMREAKSEMKQILADDLSKERIVCATASAARETKFRESFKPTAVFQDGNDRAR
ncbi:putative CCHC-type domain-containing protein [Seiridium cardinale]|uniref:CCHC-type domain-containing protein n=1 Tax=Seiridium cardinale TaxID=138064 RepID=A0ABR2XC10_9PEZI